MRKAIVLLVLGLLAASTASASTPWSEFFNYSDGDLAVVSGGSWAVHSGTPPTNVQVVSGQAVVNSANAPDINYQFRTPAEATPTDVIYGSFNLKISGTQTAAGGYFAHFMNNGTFFAARVFAALVDASTYKIGISTTSSTPVYWPTPLNKDQTYSIAIRYDAATGISTLWVDPTSLAGGVDSAVGPIGTLVSGFALRQSGGYGTATIDDIRVDVTSGVVSTTNSSWGDVKSLFR